MYLSWNEVTINNFDDQTINDLYDRGFVFTRKGKGVANQTRSSRIDLNKFELSSENRRVLRHTENITLSACPIPYADYNWSVHKMGKDFYEKKFGEKTFSAQKIKEIITDKEKSNFNLLMTYVVEQKTIGYCVCLETQNILHYCYPFYDLSLANANMGMGMMLKAILWARENNKKYFYLGSLQRPTDTYKLQFSGLEWFDGEKWRTDLDEVKKLLNS